MRIEAWYCKDCGMLSSQPFDKHSKTGSPCTVKKWGKVKRVVLVDVPHKTDPAEFQKQMDRQHGEKEPEGSGPFGF